MNATGEQNPMTVLFVDDEKSVLSSLQRFFLHEPFEKIFANNADEGLAKLAEHDVHVVVSDVHMPGMDGLTFLRKVREEYPEVVRMILSGTADLARVVEAINSGEVYRYLTKPLDKPLDIKVAIRQALDYYQLQEQRKQLLIDLEDRNRQLSEWKDRLTRELEIAGSLQRRLVDQHPMILGQLAMYKVYRPSLSIGGDVFDVLLRPDGSIAFYVADVCGHGVASALIAFMLKAVITDTLENEAFQTPADICSEVHHRFSHLIPDAELYATMMFCMFQPDTQEGQIMACGHPAPLLIRDGVVELLEDREKGGLPVGIMNPHEHPYHDKDMISFSLNPGDALVLYSDGIIEARQAETDKECGVESLQSALENVMQGAWRGNPCADIVQLLEDSAYKLDQDDCSLLMLVSQDPKNEILNEKLELSIDSVEQAGEALAEKLVDAGWEKDAASYARTVVQEYGLNVVDHSRQNDVGQVDLRALLRSGSCQLIFEDSGMEWDYREQLHYAEQYEGMAERGRGLLLLNALTAYSDVCRINDKNIGVFVVPRNRKTAPEIKGTSIE